MEIYGTIFCVGKNYPDHAREMATWEQQAVADHNEPLIGEPTIFMKPSSALSRDGTTTIPVFDGHPVSSSMHYEVELVLLVGKDADSVSIDDAAACIAGYGVGLDMTLRDVQLEQKKAGNPWLKSKGFRNSALVSAFVAPDASGPWDQLAISLRLNGRLVQHSPVSKMSFPPAYLIHYLSYIYGLRRGDLIFTGTPAGVGRVDPADRLEATLESGAESTLANLKATVI
ncbi:MAG: fumarylacetoacetate hydrolase family protein [Chlorobiaceae bacterium]|nr:fumarylacetoacetate hydrolase family protein [Chlorobiaceae bacterium]